MAQTVKYISVSGAGLKDGSSAANAWDNTQWATAIAAFDGNTKLKVAAGTYNQTGTLAFNGTAGSSTQRNTIVGVNASTWAEDGSIAVFDGGSGAYDGLTLTVMGYSEFKSLKIQNYAGYGINSALYVTLFKDIEIANCTNGYTSSQSYNTLFNVYIHNCTGKGIVNSLRTAHYFCLIKNNGGYGIDRTDNSAFFFCITHNNTTYGHEGSNDTTEFFIGCTYDNEDTGKYINTGLYSPALLFNKFTNCTTGFRMNASSDTLVYEDFNSFYNNGTDKNFNGSYSDNHGVNDITLTSDEYNDLANDDFNTSSDADSINIEIDFADGINKAYMSTQFPPIYGSGGGRQPRLRINGA